MPGSASEQRRGQMAHLRRAILSFYRMADPPVHIVRQALAYLQQLVEVMKRDGLQNMELCFVFTEQARLLSRLGETAACQNFMRKALQARILCLGYDHPSCRQGGSLELES